MGFKEYYADLLKKAKEAENQFNEASKTLAEKEYFELGTKKHEYTMKVELLKLKINNLVNKWDSKKLEEKIRKSNNPYFEKIYKRSYIELFTKAQKNAKENEISTKSLFENKDFSGTKTYEDLDKLTKEIINHPDYKEKFEKDIKEIVCDTVARTIQNDIDGAIKEFGDLIKIDELDSLEKEIEEGNIFEKEEFKSTLENPKGYEKLDELILIHGDEETRKNLNYLKENALKTQNLNLKLYKSWVGDSFLEYHENKVAYNAMNVFNNTEDHPFKDVLKSEKGKTIQGENFNKLDSKIMIEEFKKQKFVFSEETKEKIKKVLKILSEMKYIDGKPIFNEDVQEEEGNKIYAFRAIMDDKDRMNAIINKYENFSLEELKSLSDEEYNQVKSEINRITEHYRECTEKYKELMEICSNLGDPLRAPSNVSCSRNGSMPDYIMNNPIVTAKVNSIWLMLKSITESGLSIDEYLDDVNNCIHKSIESFSDYKFFDESIKNLNLTSFLVEAMPRRGSYQRLFGKVANSMGSPRRFSLFSDLESDPEINKQNNIKFATYNQITCMKASSLFSQVSICFFESKEVLEKNKAKYNKETIKNCLLAFNDKTIPKASLTCNPEVKGSICPFSGNNFNSFNYEEYLHSDKPNVEDIINNIFDVNKLFVNNETYRPEIVEATSETAKDLLLNKNCEKDSRFYDLLEMSGKSSVDYAKEKYPGQTLSQTLQTNFNNALDKHVDKDNISECMNNLKVLYDKYYSKFIFFRIFSGESKKEDIAINEMRNELVRLGVSRDDIQNVLKKKETVDNMRKNFEDNNISFGEKPVHKEKIVRTNVNIEECNDKGINIETGANINTEKKKTAENKMGMNINNGNSK